MTENDRNPKSWKDPILNQEPLRRAFHISDGRNSVCRDSWRVLPFCLFWGGSKLLIYISTSFEISHTKFGFNYRRWCFTGFALKRHENSSKLHPRSSFVALFSGRLGCWLLFEISVRKSSSSPKRLLLQFTYDFPGFISCCITMLRIQPHSILCQLNSLMWAIDKTKWSNDKWPANRQGQPPPTFYPPKANKIKTLNSDQPC